MIARRDSFRRKTASSFLDLMAVEEGLPFEWSIDIYRYSCFLQDGSEAEL
jgi:hypothetical protein